MKKLFSYLLISSMVVLSSCTNYDDQFDDLNAQIDTLKTQIEGFTSLTTDLNTLQASVTSLQTAVNALPTTTTDISGLESDLADVATKLDELETALGNTATAAEVEELQVALAAAQADITSILASNNVYTGALNITNTAELTFATELGDRVAIVNGDVSVTVSTANGLDAAAVSAITSKIGSVVGNVAITSNVSLNLSSLTGVSGSYTVTGHDIDDSALASAGDVTLNYDGGYVQPALTTVGAISMTNYATAAATTTTPATVGTLMVDLMGLTSATSIQTGSTVGSIDFTRATSVKVGDVYVDNLSAPEATEVHLGYDGVVTVSNTILVTAAKATSIAVAAKEIGAITIDGAASSMVSFPALTKATGTITADATTISADMLKESVAINLPNVTALSLPVLAKTTSGTITAALATSFSAPVLEASAAVDLAAATSIELGSIATANLTVKNAATSLKFNALNTAFSTAGMVKLASLESNAKTNAAQLTVAADNVVLISVNAKGKHGSLTVGTDGTDGLDKLTALTTEDTIGALTIQNTKALVMPTLGHKEDAATGATVTIKSNAKLSSFTTAVDKVTSFTVTGNTVLASFDASSMVSLPQNTTASSIYTVNVAGNFSGTGAAFADAKGLTGNYKAAVAATATAPATVAEFHQNSLLTLKPYLTAVLEAALPSVSTTAATANAAGSALTIDYLYGVVSGDNTTATTIGVFDQATPLVAAHKTAVSGIKAE